MSLKFLLVFFFFSIITVVYGNKIESRAEHVTHKGNVYPITWLDSVRNSAAGQQRLLNIYCHCGAVKTLLSVWQTVYIDIVNASDFQLFEGSNASGVLLEYSTHLSSWVSLLPWRHSGLSLPAFSTHCVGVVSDGQSEFSVQLVVRRINYWRIIQMVGGAILFLTAPSICRNAVFYYTSGISIGVFASLLILIFLISRLMPRKSAAYSVILFGGSFVVYVFQKLYSNARSLITAYTSFLLSYVAVAAVVSFAVCYRYQPMTDHRSQNLIQWAFQLLGIVLVFFASEFQEFSMAVVIVIVATYNVPALWVAKARTFWKSRFPPTMKLLSEAEYLDQMNSATKTGLEDLRKYCSSPDCKQWKYVSSLKDPVRFARFVEGESHLRDDEILKYDGDSLGSNISDDDDDVTEIITDED